MIKKNISKFIINNDLSIKRAILKMNKLNPPILFSVNKKKIFIGTLTDGDIRRYLLKNNDLTIPVKKIINKKPLTCNINSFIKKKNFYEESLKTRYLKGIPILKSKKIISLFLADTFDSKNYTPIMIMAGGKGKRLLPYTKYIPKPLVKINKTPIIHLIVKKILNENFINVIVSINYYGNQIKNFFNINDNFGLKVKFIEENKSLGTAGSLSLIDKKGIENLIVINADIVTELRFEKILNYHTENKFDLTIGCMNYNHQIPFGVVKRIKKKFHMIEEKPTIKSFVNTGIYVINKKLLKKINVTKFLRMTDVINNIVDKKKVGIFPMHEEWIDIGNKENLLKARKNQKKIK